MFTHSPRRGLAGWLFLSVLCLSGGMAFAEPRGFDFGSAEGPPAQGFKRFTGKDLYTPQSGAGFDKAWGISWRRPDVADAIISDGITAERENKAAPEQNDVIFRVAVPNGVYAVTVWLGDPAKNEGRMGMCVATNGRTVLPAPGVGGWGQVTQRTLAAVVDKGELAVRFFIIGEGSSHRLSILGLLVEEPADAPAKAALQRQWEQAPSVDAPVGTIQVGDKTYTEVGRRHEPALGELPKPWSDMAVLPFLRNNPGDMMQYSVPRGDELVSRLQTFAAQDDIQPMYVGLHARRKVQDVRVACGDLTGPGSVIAGSAVDIRLMTTRPRATQERPDSTAILVTDLLDAYAPFDLDAGTSRGVYLRVPVAKDQPAGWYRGTLTVTPAAAEPLKLPVELLVLPISLSRPPGKVWHLFADVDRWLAMDDVTLRQEVQDMARHGVNSLIAGYPPLSGAYVEESGKIVGADLGRVGDGLRIAYEAGARGPVMIGTPGSLLRFRGWSVGHQGSASHTYAAADTGRALVLKHEGAKDSSGIASISGSKFAPGKKVRLEVRYQLEGSGSAVAQLGFMKSYKRDPVNDARVNMALESGGEGWRSAWVTSIVPADAPFARMTLDYRGGPGTLRIDRVLLLDEDGKFNRAVNGDFDRDVEMPDLKAEKWPEPFMAEFSDSLKALCQAIERTGFTPVIEGTDEAGNNPAEAHKEINELVAAKRTGYATWCNLSVEMARKMGDIIDAVCFYTSLVGDESAAKALRDEFHAAGKKTYLISSGCYMGQDYDWMPNRHGVGLAFWKSGYDGTGMWTYQRPLGDPFNDFDDGRRDYFMVFPPRTPGGRPVPTLGWEGAGEGWKDYCYVHTLELATAEATKAGRNDDAALGATVLDFIRAAVPWYGREGDGGFDNVAIGRLRWLAAWATLRLQGALPASANAPAAGKLAEQSVSLKFAAPTAPAKVQPLLLCPPASTPPSIDGKIDEDAWKNAAVIDAFVDYRNASVKANARTEVRLLHDADNVYLAVRCDEPAMDKLKAEITADDGNVFADDSIEIFLDTDNDQWTFDQLAFNAAGARFDMRCAGGNDAGQSIFQVDYAKQKVRDPKWNGKWTVKTSRHADRWEAEVVLPFSTFGRDSDLWGLHVARNRRAADPQTSTHKVIGMFHQPERFSQMLLAGARSGSASRIESLTLPAFRFGIVPVTVPVRDGKALKASAEVINGKGEARAASASISPDGSTAFLLSLTETDRRARLTITDAAGRPAHQLLLPVAIEPAIEARSRASVLFSSDARGAFNLAVRLADPQSAGLKLEANLRDAGKQSLGRSVSDVTSDGCRIDLDLRGRAPGIYHLDLIVTDKAGREMLRRDEQIMIVPDFALAFAVQTGQ